MTGKTIIAVAAGSFHSLALASDGTIFSWGDNMFGQLGIGNNTNSNIPIAVSTSGVLSGKKVTNLAAGTHHTIVLASDGTIYSWGRNQLGQLGDNSTTDVNIPISVTISEGGTSKKISAIATRGEHCMALASDGAVYAWGNNDHGQLGLGNWFPYTFSKSPQRVATGVNGKVISISVGYQHSILVTSIGSIYSWGANYTGQLGTGTGSGSNVPVEVYKAGALLSKTINSAVAGLYHNLAIDSEGLLYSWGSNLFGQLGYADGNNNSVPNLVYQSFMGLLPVEESSASPEQFEISQNYPNPFNPETAIEFTLPVSGNVKVVVYSTLGEVIAEVVNSAYSAGTHKVSWNAGSSGVASGVYFYEVSVISDNGKEFREMKKMILLK